jgi:hypothetical protein
MPCAVAVEADRGITTRVMPQIAKARAPCALKTPNNYGSKRKCFLQWCCQYCHQRPGVSSSRNRVSSVWGRQTVCIEKPVYRIGHLSHRADIFRFCWLVSFSGTVFFWFQFVDTQNVFILQYRVSGLLLIDP